MRDFIMGLIVITALSGFAVLSSWEMKKQRLKKQIYAECLSTSKVHDKFECYSMIYGDK